MSLYLSLTSEEWESLKALVIQALSDCRASVQLGSGDALDHSLKRQVLDSLETLEKEMKAYLIDLF